MDAAIERAGMYSQRVQKTYVDQLLYSFVVKVVVGYAGTNTQAAGVADIR